MALNVKLVVVGGEVKTTEITLKLPSTIGRGRGTAVVLPHPLVSRNHCELYEADGKLMVRDLGSLNGTFVNNERITEAPAQLAPGELLTVGTVTFRAVYIPPGGGDDEGRTMSVTKPSEKTVRVSKSGTVQARPKPKQPAADSNSDELDLNFGQSLFEEEEISPQAPGGAGHVTERMKARDVSDNSQTPPAGNKPVKKSPARPQAADDEEEGKLNSSSDDGLDDFLKDLKK